MARNSGLSRPPEFSICLTLILKLPRIRLLARYGLPTLYEWRVKPTGILVTYDGLSNVASPLGLPAALGEGIVCHPDEKISTQYRSPFRKA